MPKFVFPRSDRARIYVFDKTISSSASDLAKGDKYIPEELVIIITAFRPLFSTSYLKIMSLLEKRKQETGEQSAAFSLLDVTCNDLLHGIKRRVYRENLPKPIMGFYGIPLDGAITRPTTQSDMLDLGRVIVAGDAESVAAGNEAAANPSAANVQTALAAAIAENNERDSADRDLDKEQAVLAGLRETADGHIVDIIEELRHSLRKMDEPSQRRIIRSYGFKFEYSPGEPQPPEAPVLTYVWEGPNIILSCDPDNTADAYEFVYSEDNVNWHALYAGAETTYTYAPPVGTRFYKVRAENELGYGEYSEVVEFTKPEVPQ